MRKLQTLSKSDTFNQSKIAQKINDLILQHNEGMDEIRELKSKLRKFAHFGTKKKKIK